MPHSRGAGVQSVIAAALIAEHRVQRETSNPRTATAIVLSITPDVIKVDGSPNSIVHSGSDISHNDVVFSQAACVVQNEATTSIVCHCVITHRKDWILIAVDAIIIVAINDIAL